MPPPSLNELDAKIAALEAQLAGDSSSDSDLEPIPPLDESLLPEFYTQDAARRRGGPPPQPPPLRRPVADAGDPEAPQKKKRRKEGAEAEPLPPAVVAAQPSCDVCGLRFSSEAQLQEHLRGKKHLTRERQLQGPEVAGGGGPRPRPTVFVPAGPHFCQLCRKDFTSSAQLVEHRAGKWHQARSKGEQFTSRKPLG